MLTIASQIDLTSTSLTDIYTAPPGGRVLRCIVVANRSASLVRFRMSVADSGEADALKQYIYYDTPVLANDSFTATLDIGLRSDDVVRCKAGTANALSVTLFGGSQS